MTKEQPAKKDEDAHVPKQVLVARMYKGKQEFLVHWEGWSVKLKDLTWEPRNHAVFKTPEGKAIRDKYEVWAKKQQPTLWPPKSGVQAKDYCS